MEENKSKITKEQLLEFGFKMTEEPFVGVSMEKILGDGEAGKLSIAVVHWRNTPEIALVMPGALIYLNVGTIDQLKQFADMLYEYEPN
jgi:hypothetical protein